MGNREHRGIECYNPIPIFAILPVTSKKKITHLSVASPSEPECQRTLRQNYAQKLR